MKLADSTHHASNLLFKQVIQIIAICLGLMFFLGIVAEFFVRSRLITWHDPYQTYRAINESMGLFSTGILSFIVIIILDIILSACFYLLFNSVNYSLSLLMAGLRLLYVAVKGGAIVGLVIAKDIYTSTDELNKEQLDVAVNQAFIFLKIHHTGFAIGLIFFGMHLLLLALLVQKLTTAPYWISWFLFIASFGYVLNSVATLFFSDHAQLFNLIIGVFIVPMSFSEVFLAGWLFVKRRKIASILSAV
ncbi:uncharacterized protein DUF4386 [Larkinella arboricola]|uniref:Uncharacterized protein DUF4386 n=1 Tax=Larkinella arboricola TaxID=643671 RepID=A0A327WNW1_LARAB|nr:DUF4386 domain-containing protein [Larkinella arboricola]RAJ93214.1 uncharacterized protein DUF4386 [Larkinella arboricola]